MTRLPQGDMCACAPAPPRIHQPCEIDRQHAAENDAAQRLRSNRRAHRRSRIFKQRRSAAGDNDETWETRRLFAIVRPMPLESGERRWIGQTGGGAGGEDRGRLRVELRLDRQPVTTGNVRDGDKS